MRGRNGCDRRRGRFSARGGIGPCRAGRIARRWAGRDQLKKIAAVERIDAALLQLVDCLCIRLDVQSVFSRDPPGQPQLMRGCGAGIGKHRGSWRTGSNCLALWRCVGQGGAGAGAVEPGSSGHSHTPFGPVPGCRTSSVARCARRPPGGRTFRAFWAGGSLRWLWHRACARGGYRLPSC